MKDYIKRKQIDDNLGSLLAQDPLPRNARGFFRLPASWSDPQGEEMFQLRSVQARDSLQGISMEYQWNFHRKIQDRIIPHPFWVNYNNSPTWIKAIWGWFPLLTMIPVRSQWGRYNLPRSFVICHFPNIGCGTWSDDPVIPDDPPRANGICIAQDLWMGLGSTGKSSGHGDRITHLWHLKKGSSGYSRGSHVSPKHVFKMRFKHQHTRR